MSLKLYSLSFILIAALFSCSQKSEKDEIDESLLNAVKENKPADSTLANSNTVQPANAVVNPLAAPAPGSTAPVFSVPVNQTQTQVQTQPAQSGTVALNPAHGQPGHRCDINVGAPLNSKPPALPNANPATTISTAPPANTTVQNAAQQTLPGMNPAHGQPGHRCDIAVGAPLNSKPAPAAIPVGTNVAPPVKSAALPADSSKN
ncbi:hypothetical protein [Ferruginibacter sp.]|nr:hypothetical protein [Ferruginibacter sp.]